ncbi:MAG: tryptophan synthase subunit alpha [Methanobrevibacter sp.]|nr:tryptophan synthase subunit alpha [Methanobrevibacter sp.]
MSDKKDIKIADAFKDGKAFIGFLTAGDPTIEKTVEYVLAMEEAGCDLVEIGIPFSDPVAEGPVIQEANIRALSNNTNTDDVFEAIRQIREKSDVPLVFLTYINPVFYYGYDKFFKRCQELNVCGIISPDLPYDEKDEILEVTQKYGIDIISLIAPTSKERIQMIASEASGFIYVVSSLGVTGMRSEIRTDLKSILEDIKEVTDVPAAVGFGINTPEQAENIAKVADGVIVGSAIVNIIAEHGENAKEPLAKYVQSMKDAIS